MRKSQDSLKDGFALMANMLIAGTLIYTMVRIVQTTPPTHGTKTK